MPPARPASRRLRLLPPALLLAACAVSARAQVVCDPAGILGLTSLSNVGDIQRHVEAADLNGDGRPDLVVSTSNAMVIMTAGVPSNGVVPYQFRAAYRGILDATGSAIADFDGDGINDIAVACFNLDTRGVAMFRGLGSGGVGNGDFAPLPLLGSAPMWDVVAADLNADGILDLVASQYGRSLAVFLGQSDGGRPTGTFLELPPTTTPNTPRGLAVADMDKDGIPDVVMGCDDGRVAVFRQNATGGSGNGTFTLAATPSSAGEKYDVAVADLNRDGWLDIASADYSHNSISVFLGGPAMSFQAPLVHSTYGLPLGIAIADFNDDGLPDVVAAAAGSGVAFSYFQTAPASLAHPDGLDAYHLFGGSRVSYGITATDLNGDGAPDVLVPGVAETALLAAFNRCESNRPRTLTTLVSGSGSVTANPPGPTFPRNSNVELLAVPAPQWVFSHWLGDLTGSENPDTLVMNQDRTVTAVFIPVQRALTITVDGRGQGSVTRSPALPTYDNDSVVRLTAVPLLGSRFEGWSGDVTSTANPLDVTMSVDRSIVATFGPDPARAPTLVSVQDVPFDQGGAVKLRWRASVLEAPDTPADFVTVRYDVWRAVRPGAAVGPARVRRTRSGASTQLWEIVGSQPASRFTGYSLAVHTAEDSTPAGVPRETYLVQAVNATGTHWVDSAPDSGYSVDDLPPGTPSPFVAEYASTGTTLHWGPSRAPDLQGYRLHRGPNTSFVPSAANLIGEPTGTTFFDASTAGDCYKLAAVDVHGNRSAYIGVSPQGPVATLGALVAAVWSVDRIVLDWLLTRSGEPVTVYRHDDASYWQVLARTSADGRGLVRFEDTSVERGRLYTYRLGIQDGGEEVFLPEVTVLAEDARLALEGVTPNPAGSGHLTVRFVLPDALPAQLDLVDVTGRRVATRELQGQPGPQSLEWSPEQRLRPGLYWLRLRHPGGERRARVVVVD